MSTIDRIPVVCAIIQRENEVLVAQKPKEGRFANLWEFPGGKVQTNEGLVEAIIREIKEELDCDILVADKNPICVVNFTYDSNNTDTNTGTDNGCTIVPKTIVPKIAIRLFAMRCRLLADSPPRANEHQCLKWLKTSELKSLCWVPADLDIVDELTR